ncbi:MAG: L,D-transpeptidase [Cyanobacteria bacterium P01_D01_bin.44]
MLSDQEPLNRCFVLLCFCSAIGLLVFECADPLALRKENVVMTSLAPLSVMAADPPSDENSAAAVDARLKGAQLLAIEIPKPDPSETNLSETNLSETNPSGTVKSGTVRPGTAGSRKRPQWSGRRPLVTSSVAQLSAARSEAQPDTEAPIPEATQVEVRVKLATRQVKLYRQGELVEQYPVAIGQDDWQTPVGVFEVLQMQQNPAWQHPVTHDVIEPGPDNPLGARWIGFWSDGTHQIGFHGTNQEALIGQAVSHGCIRMRNQDIQKLYDQLALGTLITVEP